MMPRPRQRKSVAEQQRPLSAQLDRSSFSSFHDGGDEAIQQQAAPQEQLATKETKAVTGVRCLAWVVLIVSTIIVGFSVYFVTSDGERKQFEIQYREDANKVLQAIGASLDMTLGGIDALAVSMVSHARATNQTWPYVTIPDYAVRAEKTRSLTRAVYISTFAYVADQEERAIWEPYSAEHGPQWVEETFDLQERENVYQDVGLLENATNSSVLDEMKYWNVIHHWDEFDKEEPGVVGLHPNASGPFLPMWQSSPIIPGDQPYNWDYLSSPNAESIHAVIDTHQVTISEAYLIAFPNDTELIQENEEEANWVSSFLTTDEEPMEPMTQLALPILAPVAADWVHVPQRDDDPSQYKVGGILTAAIYWRKMIEGILAKNSDGIDVLFDNPCSPTFTYRIYGPTVMFLGTGDFHESQYNHMETKAMLLDLHEYSLRGSTYSGIPVSRDFCPYTLRVYPSSVMEQSFQTSSPAVYTAAAVGIFAFCGAVFILYDACVERRQRVVLSKAQTSDAIVSELFPNNVKQRLYTTHEQAAATSPAPSHFENGFTPLHLPNLLTDFFMADFMDTRRRSIAKSGSGRFRSDAPIAELFPNTSVLFADLAGFTQWSASRDPPQVFVLLETLYGAFDALASARGVFKIETIGDCYVAVAGLPEPRRGHFAIMVRFAAACRDQMNTLVKDLEPRLGPGTSSLQLRSGVHSGPLTAGVLRTSKGRFQIFGDTVNTAARMESNGSPNRIHVSQQTAELLIASGRENWLIKRKDMIEAKGKGKLQTYFAEPKSNSSSSGESQFFRDSWFLSTEETDRRITEQSPDGISMRLYAATVDRDTQRLVDWAAVVFEEALLRLVLDRKNASGGLLDSITEAPELDRVTNGDYNVNAAATNGEHHGVCCPRDELVEGFRVAPFRSSRDKLGDGDNNGDGGDIIELSPSVSLQLRMFISDIAQHYNPNAFHCFDRAAQVTLSTKRLLRRIGNATSMESKYDLYRRSFGIALDHLVQVGMLYAALTLDLGHTGVNNEQLVKEDPFMANRYKNQSVAEQNAVDVAWDLLMKERFDDLRACVFASPQEQERFRMVVVHAVLATDLEDAELAVARNDQWNDAFQEATNVKDDHDASELLDRKATLVAEHLMQASAMSHTMQHWSVYQKWSNLLFREQMSAYASGRAEYDPSATWYERELAFFDNHVIPLATKLNDCKVFGDGHEFLEYAQENRTQWKEHGQSIVQQQVFLFYNDNNNGAAASRMRASSLSSSSLRLLFPETTSLSSGSSILVDV